MAKSKIHNKEDDVYRIAQKKAVKVGKSLLKDVARTIDSESGMTDREKKEYRKASAFEKRLMTKIKESKKDREKDSDTKLKLMKLRQKSMDKDYA